jgi:hypothetical protein
MAWWEYGIPGYNVYKIGKDLLGEDDNARTEAASRDIRDEAGKASSFGTVGEQNYGALGAEAGALRGQLRDQASGKLSMSKEQLRQGLQQNLSAQSAMAAGARPGSAPMAARTAMMNAGRMGAGMSGQAAMAGIAERQAAQSSLGGMIMNQRDQDLRAALAKVAAEGKAPKPSSRCGLWVHGFRHYFAQLARNRGAGTELSAHLGHSSISFTDQTYAVPSGRLFR